MLTPAKSNERYIYILSDGILRENVGENVEGAIKRDWETKDGKKGTKWERTYAQLEGYIADIKFDEGEYGKQLQLTVVDEGFRVVLTLPVAQNFGEDVLKKLPNVDFSQRISFVPYSFITDDKKLKKGVNLYQGDKKVFSHYYIPSKIEGEKGTIVNGYPEPSGDEEDADDWKAYFTKARKFMIKEVEEKVIPRLKETPAPLQMPYDGDEPHPYPAENINPEDIPF